MRFTSILALALPFTLATSSIVVLKDQDELASGGGVGGHHGARAGGGGGGGGGGDDDGRGACLRSCFPDKPACPKNMDPYKLGDCWSCCLKQRSQPQPPHRTVIEIDVELDDSDDFADGDRMYLA
ncbi:uncharacterized protein BDV17DRAFT_276941 [Aspergillus undulatus]|uniref:uncharacterized protein n=1 Tax=Aspergillus undulatus TaxID=1810928 RepID=UPI003CCE08C1